MNHDNYQEMRHRLHHDYLELCESYQHDLPIHEFGFALTSLVASMLFDCAPSEMVARETLRMGIEDGYREHVENKGDA